MKKFLLMISLTMLIAFSANPSARAMTAHQKDVCDTWIHGSATAAAGSAAVLAQAPGTDNVALVGILATLTVRLAAVFDLDLDLESAGRIAKAFIVDAWLLGLSRTASQFILGWIPILGNGINAATAAGVVEWIGWETANLFDTGISLSTIAHALNSGAEGVGLLDKLRGKSE